jgi:hypothetical protein
MQGYQKCSNFLEIRCSIQLSYEAKSAFSFGKMPFKRDLNMCFGLIVCEQTLSATRIDHLTLCSRLLYSKTLAVRMRYRFSSFRISDSTFLADLVKPALYWLL